MLTDDDKACIAALTERFAYLAHNFEIALSVAPDGRYEWAQDKVYDVARGRYARLGVPVRAVESVGEHILESIGLATLHCPDDCNGDTVEQLILVHDLPQAITFNLRSEPEICPDLLRSVNDMAARVIFEAEPQSYDLWREYEAQKTREAKIARDIQNAQMVFKILEYREAFPALCGAFTLVLKSMEAVWQTETGRDIYRNAIARYQGIMADAA